MSKKNKPFYIHYSGSQLLENPLLNKGAAFSLKEREEFNLTGLVPDTVETIEQQAERAYQQFNNFKSHINRHVYLRNIQDTNETLFYYILRKHLHEMMPIIYTPTVGEACQEFSKIYRRARGLFISYENQDHIDNIINNYPFKQIRIIVITDGERVLGLGDQGIGGMGISIGELSLYTACAGISPIFCLPITLDVGTNTQEKLDNPLYMGLRHRRITGKKYFDFVDKVLVSLAKKFPEALIQFEDFAQNSATPLLENYKNKICCFNDDIQGTASVTLGTLLAACNKNHIALHEQNIIFIGAGSAGCGIAEMLIKQMKIEGLSENNARKRIFMIDKFGLLTNKSNNLLDFQKRLAQNKTDLAEWRCVEQEKISAIDVIHNAKPTIIIGVSGVYGLFSEEIITAMIQNVDTPIIFPLSNPTKQIEALPEDILHYTKGNCLIATGSPFAPIHYDNKIYHITQCNNSYIFPGIGLAKLACNYTKITDNMLIKAATTLSELDFSTSQSDKENVIHSLLPDLKHIDKVSKAIAFAVVKQGIIDEACQSMSDKDIIEAINANFWYPRYHEYIRSAFFY